MGFDRVTGITLVAQRDPIVLYSSRLKDKGFINDEQLEAMEEEVADSVSKAIDQAEADPHPALEDRFNDILAEKYPLKK